MIVKIGVTGHRFLAELDKIDTGIKNALQHIEKHFPHQILAILSPLAEGTDRLVAKQVLQHPKAELIVPLPLPQEDFETDFETEESKNEFRQLLSQAAKVIRMPPGKSRNEAYEITGKYILENCDALLTIWDGQGAQGQGGTGEIVTIARERKLPIAWIHAGNRKPNTQEATSLGKVQGKVTFENF